MDLNKYTIQGSRDIAQVLSKNNLRWLTLRWYYMLLIAAVAMIASLLATLSLERIYEYGLILFGGYVLNAILFFLAHYYREALWTQRLVLGSQIFLDLILCGLIVYVGGGVEARTTVLFAVPIIASGLSFLRNLVLPVAGVSGIIYSVTILAHAQLTRGYIEWPDYAVPVIFYPLIFLIIGRVVEFLTTLEATEVKERAYNSFLSLLAHQLKHPASASKAIIDVIEHDEQATHTKQTQHYLELLRGENENQIRLINNLLEAAPRKREELHTECLNIVLYLEKAAHQAAEAHQRRGDLIRDEGAGGAIEVDADPIKLQLALSNIFDNSFRHTPDGSAVHYGIAFENGAIEVTISDDGDGISQANLRAIKERFSVGNIHDFGTKHVGGLGLGIYISQQIIAAHGGTLTVQSKEGSGTTVKIRMKGEKR